MLTAENDRVMKMAEIPTEAAILQQLQQQGITTLNDLVKKSIAAVSDRQTKADAPVTEDVFIHSACVYWD